MARVEIDKAWLVKQPGNRLDSAIDRVVQDHGITATRGGHGIEMRGGSQLKMRFLGGWFTKDRVLPKWGSLQRVPADTGEAGVELITLRLEDRMGLMDPGMRSKYQRIFESIAFSVEAALRDNVADVKDAHDPGAAWATTSAEDRVAPSAGAFSTAGELERLADVESSRPRSSKRLRRSYSPNGRFEQALFVPAGEPSYRRRNGVRSTQQLHPAADQGRVPALRPNPRV